MGTICLCGSGRRRDRFGNTDIVDVERGGVGGQQEGLWVQDMEGCRTVGIAFMDEMSITISSLPRPARERGSLEKMLSSYPLTFGIAILPTTCPFSDLAALTSPSVPALYKIWPSTP